MNATVESQILIRDPFRREIFNRECIGDGADRFDEVWEGTYIAMPQPNDEHQEIVTMLSYVLTDVIQMKRLGKVRAGTNVSDRAQKWTENYRCPDVAVMLDGGRAERHPAYWRNGPDFLIEIVSPDDGAREKIPFYSKVGVRELLIVDRDPWQLEILRHDGAELRSAGLATPDNAAWISADVVGLQFSLAPGAERPVIEVKTVDGSQSWRV